MGHRQEHVPDGGTPSSATDRTTDLGIMAHPDDLEMLALPGIIACRDVPDRSFTGVVCTDGSGAGSTERRWQEQCLAADLGRYGIVIGLGHTSEEVRTDGGHATLVNELEAFVGAARPANVYTHNPADKHRTHVAVAAALLLAIRRMPLDARPHRLVGVEAWRDLDWLPDSEKVRLDVSGDRKLADGLIRIFSSQIELGKSYDLAAAGRRRANATLADPHAQDTAEEVIIAMDLSPLIHNDDLDPVRFIVSAIDRFRSDVARTWAQWF